MMIRFLILALAALALITSADAGSLPEGPGLADGFPGDSGISKDPRVLFAEGFEEGTVQAVFKRWDSASAESGRVLSLCDDVPFRDAGAGRRSLKITAHPGEDTGGHLYTRLPRGVETAFARFYVKFP